MEVFEGFQGMLWLDWRPDRMCVRGGEGDGHTGGGGGGGGMQGRPRACGGAAGRRRATGGDRRGNEEGGAFTHPGTSHPSHGGCQNATETNQTAVLVHHLETPGGP